LNCRLLSYWINPTSLMCFRSNTYWSW